MRSRLLAAALTALLAFGAAACDTGTSAEGGGVPPDEDVGADTGSTGEGFDDTDVGEDAEDAEGAEGAEDAGDGA